MSYYNEKAHHAGIGFNDDFHLPSDKYYSTVESPLSGDENPIKLIPGVLKTPGINLLSELS